MAIIPTHPQRENGWLMVVTLQISATVLLFGLVAPVLASLPRQKKPDTILMQTDDLQKALHHAGIRVLDTRPPEEYSKGHIPGAISADVKKWQELARREGGLRDAKSWGELIGRLGIGRQSQVVVYGSSLPDTARAWWTLKYLGVDKVAILDGGWNAWIGGKRPTETSMPSVTAVAFEPTFQIDRLEVIESLKQSLDSPHVKILDARSQDEFTGKEVRGKRGGHIPGSIHLEWKELLVSDGRFKTPEQLRKLFQERGIAPEDTAVTC
jgi:thiosulfate/3-mercaptopyruvate sulfurtransferase